MGQTVLKPTPPVGGRLSCAKARPDPNLVSRAHLDGAGWHVIGPQVESATACEIEPRIVPMTGQNAVLDASAVQGKTHMRAAVV